MLYHKKVIFDYIFSSIVIMYTAMLCIEQCMDLMPQKIILTGVSYIAVMYITIQHINQHIRNIIFLIKYMFSYIVIIYVYHYIAYQTINWECNISKSNYLHSFYGYIS